MPALDTTLDHINLVVRDLEAAKSFFALFGYAKEQEGRLTGEWISKVVGLPNVEAAFVRLRPADAPSGDRWVAIELIRYDRPAGSADPLAHRANQLGLRHIAFATEDIQATADDLRSAGVEFMGEVMKYPATGKQLLYVKGPEGVIVELAQYQE